MDFDKIKVGSTYPYTSRTITDGRGKVEKKETKGTGAWVTVYDKARNKTTTVRPSQIGAVARKPAIKAAARKVAAKSAVR